MDRDLCLQRSPALEINEASDGFLVYQPDRDRLHLLNATAVLILDACDGSLRVGELPALVAEAFGLPAPPVADVEACVADLLREGLLTASPAPGRDRG